MDDLKYGTRNKRGDWTPEIHAMALHSWRRDLFRRKAEGLNYAPQISSLISRLSSLSLGTMMAHLGAAEGEFPCRAETPLGGGKDR